MSETRTFTSTIDLIAALEALPQIGKIEIPDSWPVDALLRDDHPMIKSCCGKWATFDSERHAVILDISHTGEKRGDPQERTELTLWLYCDDPDVIINAIRNANIYTQSQKDKDGERRSRYPHEQRQRERQMSTEIRERLLALDGVREVTASESGMSGGGGMVIQHDADTYHLYRLGVGEEAVVVVFVHDVCYYTYVALCDQDADCDDVADRIEAAFVQSTLYKRREVSKEKPKTSFWSWLKESLGF